MTSRLDPIAPAAAADLIDHGHAMLIDIREADEFARRHVPGAISRPLSAFGAAAIPAMPGTAVIFTCKTGMRTGANAALLAAAVTGPAQVLTGGVDAWAAAGLPVATNAKAPLEMMRQVQIVAGSLVLLGVVMGLFVAPGWFGVAAFVGAGLALAGVTGFCGLAKVLALLPWNRRAAA